MAWAWTGDSSLIDDVADDNVDGFVVFVDLEKVEIFLDTGDGFVATSGSAQANFVVNNTRIQSAFICFTRLFSLSSTKKIKSKSIKVSSLTWT